MEDNANRKTKLPLIIGLLGVGTGVWFAVMGIPGGSSLSPNELVSLTNRGLASVENIPNKLENDGTESIRIFTSVVRETPDAMLGVRNLAIAGVLAVEKQHAKRDEAREKYNLTLELAKKALVALREKDPDSGIVDMLEAKLYVTLDNEVAAANLYRTAYEKNPDDSLPLMELFALLRNGQGEERARVVREAAEVNPDNLIVLENVVRLQAESRDSDIIQTLNKAVAVLSPYKSLLADQKIDLASELPEFTAAIEAGDDSVWTKVKIRMIQVFNVVKQDFGYHTDMVQLQRHPLEYLVHDFPSGYFGGRGDLQAPTGIPVSYQSFAGLDTLQGIEDVLDAQFTDFDLDRKIDMVVLQLGKLSILQKDAQAKQWQITHSVDVSPGVSRVLAVDFDRDATTTTPESYVVSDFDFLLFGQAGLQIVENVLPKDEAERTLVVSETAFANAGITGVTNVQVADLENDGDLDVALLGDQGLQLWKNHENWLFTNVTQEALPEAAKADGGQVLALADANRSLQQDLYVSGGLFENIRHGRLQWNESSDALIGGVNHTALSVFDVDNNGSVDTVAATGSEVHLVLTGNEPGGKVWKKRTIKFASESVHLQPLDYDNDGFRDLVLWGPKGIQLARNVGSGMEMQAISDLSGYVTNVDVDDVDDDGDLDLLAIEDGKIVVLSNEGGNANNWIKVRLCAEPDPMFKVQRCNVHGVGSRVDLRSAQGFQSQQADGTVLHFGIGANSGAEAVRVLWTNGIPQNLLAPESRLTFTEKQELLKGSCPYLYTWTGEKYEFFTDLLWAAPIGLQFGEGIKAPTRDWEYLLIPGENLVPVDGQYRMQVTEELWEAAYFDHIELIAIDHPIDTEVFSNEKVGPPSVSKFQVHSFKRESLRAVEKVVASNGNDITEVVSARDGIFTRLFDQRFKQGLVDEYYLELDLGDLSNAESVQLVMTGWMFPTDTSINIALSQNEELNAPRPPFISMPRHHGGETIWKEVVSNMGFPGGKTKTIVVEVPMEAFENADFRLRISSSMELYWDEILLAVDAQAGEPILQTTTLLSADLHYRGFSARLPRLNNGPERYVYDEVTKKMIWPPMAGNFTKFGDTTELILAEDNQLVVLASGDEMTLVFDELPPVRAGWKRDFLIHSVGWDKDADLNTISGHRVEPLPFSGMLQYPPLDMGEVNTSEYKAYLEHYQTRELDTGKFWFLNEN